MNDLRIETVEIASLTFDPTNARKHDGKNLDAIVGSLKLFGQRKPIVVTPDNIVVAGNGTLEAAKTLGWSEIVIARTPIGWTWDQIKAFALADNRTAELAEWDDKILADQLLELDANGWALEEFGFEALEPFPFPDENADEPLSFENLPERAKLGDHWIIGNIEIHCQDSFLYELPKATAVISDPPYGMKVDFSWYGGKVGESLGGEREIKSKHQELQKPEWDKDKFNPTRFIENVKTSALFGANYFYEFLPADGTWWVWDKRTTDSGDVQNAYGMPYEMIWISGKRKHNIIRNLWAGFTRKAEAEDKERHHPTQKPVAVMREIIEYLCTDNDIVLDPFAGSGTTLLAASQLNIRAIGIEFNPKYVDVILDRLEKQTGLEAQLLED
jgi:site-specific DNA-methyltransferase (adenine-specific)